MQPKNNKKYALSVIFLLIGIIIILFLLPRFNFLYHKYLLKQDCAFKAVTDGGISSIKDDSGRKIGYFICDNDPFYNDFLEQGDPYHPAGIWYAYKPPASRDMLGFIAMAVMYLISFALIILSFTIFFKPSTLKFI